MAKKAEDKNVTEMTEKEALDALETAEMPAVEEERLEEAEAVEQEEAVLVQSPQMVVNTTTSMRQKTNAELANETKVALKRFENEKKVKVRIPAVLAERLGPVQYVSINGVSVNIPVDGEEHEVPESHAQLVNQMMNDLK